MSGRDVHLLVGHSDGTNTLTVRPVDVTADCDKAGCLWTASGRGAERAAREHTRKTGHTVVVRRVETRIVSLPRRNDR